MRLYCSLHLAPYELFIAVLADLPYELVVVLLRFLLYRFDLDLEVSPMDRVRITFRVLVYPRCRLTYH